MQVENQNPLQASLAIAVCIEALGSERFYPRFFQWVGSLAAIGQYMVFVFSADQQTASCRLAHNVASPDLGLQLAAQYIDGNYQQDALLAKLAEELLNHPRRPACELLLRGSLTPVYRRRFFNRPELSGKFAIAVRDEASQELFYINLYHAGQSASFSPRELQLLEQNTAVISALLLRHFKLELKQTNPARLRTAALSEREAQVCEFILQGHTTKSMARLLAVAESSIVTYRKRAYQKLQISRKSELLSLFRPISSAAACQQAK